MTQEKITNQLVGEDTKPYLVQDINIEDLHRITFVLITGTNPFPSIPSLDSNPLLFNFLISHGTKVILYILNQMVSSNKDILYIRRTTPVPLT